MIMIMIIIIIYLYLGLLVTILNYIAALLILSSKTLSHLLRIMRSDDMVIFSLNFKGLSNNPKPRETFLWLKKNRFLYIFVRST